jgi:hypothetical protein
MKNYSASKGKDSFLFGVPHEGCDETGRMRRIRQKVSNCQSVEDRRCYKPVVFWEELEMAERSLSDDLGKEMAGKAITWGPAIAGGLLLGPLGIAVGLAVSAAVVASGGSTDSPPPNGERPEK